LSGAADPIPVRLHAMRRLVEALQGPMVWMSPTDPEAVDLDFLQRAAEHVPVLAIGYDWNAPEVVSSSCPVMHADFRDLLLNAWPECATPAQAAHEDSDAGLPSPVLHI